MDDTKICSACAADLQARDEQLSAARRALSGAIRKSERLFDRAVECEDYADAATRRAYLNGLQVALEILKGVAK